MARVCGNRPAPLFPTVTRRSSNWGGSSGSAVARKGLEEMAEVRPMDVALPTRTGQEIRLRAVSRPEKHLAILLDRLDLPVPNKPKHVENVVETYARRTEKPKQMAKSYP